MQKTGARQQPRAVASARPHPLHCSSDRTALDYAIKHNWADGTAYLRSVGAQTGDSSVSLSAPEFSAPLPEIFSAAFSGDVKFVRDLLLVNPASVFQRHG
jgi:hypothetical protein